MANQAFEQESVAFPKWESVMANNPVVPCGKSILGVPDLQKADYYSNHFKPELTVFREETFTQSSEYSTEIDAPEESLTESKSVQASQNNFVSDAPMDHLKTVALGATPANVKPSKLPVSRWRRANGEATVRAITSCDSQLKQQRLSAKLAEVLQVLQSTAAAGKDNMLNSSPEIAAETSSEIHELQGGM
ncbi:hypothetical protein HDU83_002249 [Entophlyctis luteolus]|nr:hypothetical protein HDU83_002249 [Entophlyctis luteolus]KAJ3391168.1 hypothetical protein HDU84_006382 [Entophlyctis sp. JEL0112]